MKLVTRDAEAKLIESLTTIQGDPSKWQAVCFFFSRLLEHYRSEYQIKIAINMINDALGSSDGALFLCEDSTLYVLVRDLPKSTTEKMVFQLRYLFMDDPLAYTSDGEENPQFSHVYDLEQQYADFLQISKQRLTSKVRRMTARPVEAAGDKKTGDAGAESHEPDIKLLDAASLATIERDLQHADLSKVLRRQPICAVASESSVRRVFDEVYINIGHLRKMLGLDVDLLSNRWLFKYLTQLLDRRMLELMQRNALRYLDTPVSLNLNVPTLLSKQFAEFDASIKPAMKVSLVIDIQLADVLADMAGFLAAKESVHRLGYRICLDGVTELSFLQIDRAKLGFDLVKLQWNADHESDLQSASNKELAKAIKHCGANRLILSRCDTRKAVEYGQALGITLFQGRYLDMLMNPKATVEN